jgi:ABC-type uncharacterized transport system ATPase subunit
VDAGDRLARDVANVCRRILESNPVRDIEVLEPPIEDIIRRLFDEQRAAR